MGAGSHCRSSISVRGQAGRGGRNSPSCRLTLCVNVCRLVQSADAVNTHHHTLCAEAFMARTAAISLRVEPQVKAAVEKAAQEEDRTVAQWVERLVIRELRERGYLPQPAE